MTGNVVHLTEDQSLIVTLDPQEQFKLLHLAKVLFETEGVPLPEEEDDLGFSMLLTLGIHTAIHHAFELHFPSRYPEDAFESDGDLRDFVLAIKWTQKAPEGGDDG